MRKLVLLSVIIFGCVGFVSSQVRGRPESTPLSKTEKAVRRSNDLSARSSQLRNTENHPVTIPGEAARKLRKAIKPIYRKPTKDELKTVSPTDQDKAAYKLLKLGKQSGIIKLISDIGCAKNPKVVAASVDCSKYTFPGAGSAYSFRFDNYRIKRISDLNFKKNTFQALGVLTHGILVNLGDIPLEQANLRMNGMKFVNDFKPVKTMSDAAKFAGDLTKGVKKDGFTYASILPVKPNSTYVLRSVAYRGFAWREAAGIPYNELGLYGDKKRKDVIIAFRVIRFTPNETVTIIWKQLASRKSPEIKK